MANIFTSDLTNGVLATGTGTAVYTADTTSLLSSTIIGMTLANTSTSDITADVILVRSGGATVRVIDNVPIPTGSAFVPIGGDMKLVLLPNDVLRVLGSTTTIDVTVSILEITST